MNDNNILLPVLPECDVEPIIEKILSPFKLPRDVLAAPSEIETVWNNFSTILPKVHLAYRDELLARMVISVRVGLFPSAINEIWNLTILALRQRVKKFGYAEAKSFLKKDIDETYLKDIKDHELLDICVKLGLLGEKEYFFLMHNKDIRNNYSSAHPSEGGMLDGHEITSFINRCVQYVLSKQDENVGVNIHDFISTIKTNRLNEADLKTLSEKISNSFAIQRSGIITSLFGIFCDPQSNEFVRDNCERLLSYTWDSISEQTVSEMLSIYAEYSIKDSERRDLARQLFTKLGKVTLLPREEQFHIYSRALDALKSAHHNFDNFYTEIPLSEHLILIYKSIPEGLYPIYVEVVSLCYVGNSYGTSRGALPNYREMVSNFNEKQIDILINLYRNDSLLRDRVRRTERCRKMFVDLVSLLSERNISSTAKVEIDNIKKGTFR